MRVSFQSQPRWGPLSGFDRPAMIKEEERRSRWPGRSGAPKPREHWISRSIQTATSWPARRPRTRHWHSSRTTCKRYTTGTRSSSRTSRRSASKTSTTTSSNSRRSGSMDPSANSPPVPRFVFVAYYPEGPHAGPITIGLFGVQDGALLPVFASREKAIDFAVRTLGAPPRENENWDGIELPAADLIHFLLGDEAIKYVAVN